MDATLTRIDYDLRTDGDTAIGRATLAIDVLREGWTRVPIPSGLLVRDASIDGRRVSLVEGPSPQLLLSRAGRDVVVLSIASSTSPAQIQARVTDAQGAPLPGTTVVLNSGSPGEQGGR